MATFEDLQYSAEDFEFELTKATNPWDLKGDKNLRNKDGELMAFLRKRTLHVLHGYADPHPDAGALTEFAAENKLKIW